MSSNLNGIFPPIATPFDADGEILFDGFNRNLERWSETGVAGFLVLGSNGESPEREDEEKLRLVGDARPRISEDKTLIVGAGKESERI